MMPGVVEAGAVRAVDADQPAVPTRIATRQNEQPNLQLLHAKKRRHDRADLWSTLALVGTLAFAVVVPFVAMLWPSTAEWLAAAASGWLVLGKGLFQWLADSNAWNEALCGKPPRQDAVIADAGRVRRPASQLDWFYDDGKTPRPADVLLAQLEAAIWARRDHRGLVRLFMIFAVVVAGAGIIVGVAFRLTLGEYLLRLLLPCLPALQDSLLFAQEHRQKAERKERVEDQITALLERLVHGGSVNDAECRSVQDAVFQARSAGSGVPAWFYRFQRRADEAVIHATLDEWRAKIGAGAGRGQPTGLG